MGWLNKIFKGSSHRISAGQDQGKYWEEHVWDVPSTPPESKSDYENEDIDHAVALSLSEEEHRKAKAVDTGSYVEDDEQLARALQESLNVNLPLRENGNSHNFLPIPFFFSSNVRICAGCNLEIGHGRFLSCMGAVWHPECFCCHSCNRPISDYEFSMLGNNPYHKSCYKERYHPKCDVCKDFIPTNMAGLIEYRAHPFWLQKYCPSHEVDNTPRCCSCERMEPRDPTYITLGDGRKLCLECLDSSIMDDSECLPLFLEIQEFYEGLNMKITQQIPLLLKDRQALNAAIKEKKSVTEYLTLTSLNEAMEGEKSEREDLPLASLNKATEGEKSGCQHLSETRGLCFSVGQTDSTIRCILILNGLPRLLTGSILAHEMMHAWFRLNGFRTPGHLAEEGICRVKDCICKVEEGICQVLAHMWLESEIMSGSGSHAASTSSSSTLPSSSSSGLPKKVARSHFEKKLGEFFKHQIESDPSETYGDSFRAGNRSVLKYGLKTTLDHIKLTETFPI